MYENASEEDKFSLSGLCAEVNFPYIYIYIECGRFAGVRV